MATSASTSPSEEQALLVEDAIMAQSHLARVQGIHVENRFNHYSAKAAVPD